MKIASLNVHALSGNRLDRLINEFIMHYEIDVLFLQEIGLKKIKILAEKTNMSYHYAYYNGIISKLPLYDVITKKIKVKGINYDRGLVSAKIKVGARKKTFVMFHFDHKYELDRIKQLKEIEEYVNSADYFVGDFNALNRDDYDNNKWDILQQSRKDCNLEIGKHDLMDLLKKDFLIVPYSIPTTPYDTRVDYMLTKNKKDLKKIKYIDTLSCKLSDHNAIILTC